MLYALVGLLGLAIGSFLNVVIWRLPRGESVASPPSSCPGCRSRIRARDNVPVLSWLLLRGRCRDCATRISARYPLVELLTCVTFLLVFARFGVDPVLPAYLAISAVYVALALIDLDTHRLPNVLTLGVLPAFLGLLTLASLASGDWSALGRSASAGALLFGIYLVLAVIYPGGMGFGDVKLAASIGMALGYLGWGALVVGAFAAFLLGGVFGLALMASGRKGRRDGVPFGPWMVLGAAIGVAWGETLWSAYLGLVL